MQLSNILTSWNINELWEVTRIMNIHVGALDLFYLKIELCTK